ncbi:Splicing factor-like protein [Trema orientale]|uniref:Splicing factor-like protein n=1 Tax=Trema orientale TaxID=63057 RepID=A0A2P5ER16_TREOI|nr:Splicing factor-like protein [Trema orientale]
MSPLRNSNRIPSRKGDHNPHTGDETFVKYFEKYGEITDSVIMKDRQTGRPRGFGFITYADPSVVDQVIQETHVINDKQVEIKRTIPKGSQQANNFKTKKVFVGGIPTTVSDDEFSDFFSKYGKVVLHEIIRDHATQKSRGFGFIVFESETVVDNLLENGNRIDMAGTQVEIKKAEPKKASNPAPVPAFPSDYRTRPYNDIPGYVDYYSSFRGGTFGPTSYRSLGGFGNRFGDYVRYGSDNDYSSDGFPGFRGESSNGGFPGYRGESSIGYSSGFSSYDEGLGGEYIGNGLGGFGRGGYGNYTGSGPGGGYDSGLSASYPGPRDFYGSRASYNGDNRYHPYAR